MCVRRAASRVAWTAGSNSAIRMPIIAMATNSSINVKPGRTARRLLRVLFGVSDLGKDDASLEKLSIMARQGVSTYFTEKHFQQASLPPEPVRRREPRQSMWRKCSATPPNRPPLDLAGTRKTHLTLGDPHACVIAPERTNTVFNTVESLSGGGPARAAQKPNRCKLGTTIAYRATAKPITRGSPVFNPRPGYEEARHES